MTAQAVTRRASSSVTPEASRSPTTGPRLGHTMTTTCLCDTGKLYDDCCGRWHSGRPAPTALALMRSRYTAFALEFGDYLLDTWHPDTRPETLDLDPDTEWTGLRIDATSDGKAWDTEGTVTFTASFTSPDGRGELREVSRFFFDDGRWYYYDGTY